MSRSDRLLVLFAGAVCIWVVFKLAKTPNQGDVSAVVTDGETKTWRSILVFEPGPQPNRSSVKEWSNFDRPIPEDGKLHGRSRRWGDASLETQVKVIEYIVEQCARVGMNQELTAYVLAKTRTESGFNPDAAAPGSSASGLSQCINRTRKTLCRRLGMSEADPFDIQLNVALLLASTKEAFGYVEREVDCDKFSPLFYAEAYRYHHDGPRNAEKANKPEVYCGIRVAKAMVLPTMEHALKCLGCAN